MKARYALALFDKAAAERPRDKATADEAGHDREQRASSNAQRRGACLRAGATRSPRGFIAPSPPRGGKHPLRPIATRLVGSSVPSLSDNLLAGGARNPPRKALRPPARVTIVSETSGWWRKLLACCA